MGEERRARPFGAAAGPRAAQGGGQEWQWGEEGGEEDAEGEDEGERGEWEEQQTKVVRGLPDRLTQRIGAWKQVTKSKLVMSVVEHGYELTWRDGIPPAPCEKANARGCDQHEGFVDDAMEKLLEAGAIQECARKKLQCVLSVDVKVNADGKKRLCVDGRPVNACEVPRKVRFEQLGKEGREVFAGATHGGTIDLKSAYHHIKMHPRSRKFLGVFWKGKYYNWLSLPFGLHSAPWIFCTVLAEPVRKIRQQGVKMISYMDDFGFGAKGGTRAMRDGRIIIDTFEELGFLIAYEKCVGHDVPVQRFDLLGYNIHLVEQKFLVKAVRKERLKKAVRFMIDHQHEPQPAKLVASVPGRLNSMQLALGPVVRMRTRAMYEAIGGRITRREWKEKMGALAGKPAAIKEFLFWDRDLDKFDGQPIKEDRRRGVVDVSGSTDAGDKGYGGVVTLEEAGDPKVVREIRRRAREACVTVGLQRSVDRALATGLEFRGDFTMEQQARSSTWREAFGLLMLLKFVGWLLSCCKVRIVVDNISLAFGMGGLVWGYEEKAYGGSRKRDVQEVIAEIVDLCVMHKLTLIVVWVPRERNVRADVLSKMSTHYDFSLSKFAFARVEKAWGEHSIDRFSSAESVRVKSGRYNALFWSEDNRGCLAMDAFSQNWRGENNWVHAPFRLIGKVVAHMRQCGAVGTVVIPEWRGAAWWPMVRGEGGESWAADVVGVLELGNSVGFFNGKRQPAALVPSRGGSFEDLPAARLWALRFDCSRA